MLTSSGLSVVPISQPQLLKISPLISVSQESPFTWSKNSHTFFFCLTVTMSGYYFFRLLLSLNEVSKNSID